ncbi:ABC transporter ATP-binding protein [Variovorax sp. KK3]|uniref:ABC transporter ATP-binding protein n=1 Tax=Variovorax sp. KK3 TaxID=1855728 RepID=UPI003AAC4574
MSAVLAGASEARCPHPGPPPEGEGARSDYIRVEGLSKNFGGGSDGVLALSNIDCSIRQGSFVTIVGPSGCGKSTLLRILAGLLDYETGSVLLDGQPIRGTRRDVGVVFQSSILLPWRSILDNVMLPAEVIGLDMKKARERAMQLLHMVRLDGFEHKLPRQLSGGMQQRASIARALLHDPKILLMDEPFGALDAMTRERMNLELQRIWMESGKTVVLITHSIPEAVFLGDQVFVMSPRPGTLERVLPIDLPRPRTMDVMSDPAFAAATASIRERFSHAASFD